MLAWVVIDRQQPRQAAPLASLHFTPLFPLPHLSPLLPTPYGHSYTTAAPQPLCNQSVTHSFDLDGGCTPSRPSPTPNPHLVPSKAEGSPFFSHSCALFCAFFARAQNSTLLFSGDSALFAKKTPRVWGEGSLIFRDRTTSPEETASARRAGYQRWTRAEGTAAGAAPALSPSSPSGC